MKLKAFPHFTIQCGARDAPLSEARAKLAVMGLDLFVIGHWLVIYFDLDRALPLKHSNAGGGGVRHCGFVVALAIQCGHRVFYFAWGNCEVAALGTGHMFLACTPDFHCVAFYG